VVVRDLNVKSMPTFPAKANSILIIDPNTVLSGTIAL